METNTNTNTKTEPNMESGMYSEYINEEFIDACGSGCKHIVSNILLLNPTINFNPSFEIAFRIALINRHGEILKLLLEIDKTICTTFLDMKLNKMYPLDRLDIYYLNKQRSKMGLSKKIQYHSIINSPIKKTTQLCEIELREYAKDYMMNVKKKNPNSHSQRICNALNIRFPWYTFTYDTNNTTTPQLVIKRNNFNKFTYGVVAPPIGGLPIPKQYQYKTKPLGHFKEFSLNMYDSDNIYDKPPLLVREPRVLNNNNNNNNGLIGFILT